LFVTYRLAGSVPKSTVREYKARKVWLESQVKRARRLAHNNKAPELTKWIERIETFKREWFLKFEAILHQAKVGPMWMRDERVAEAVAGSLRALDGKDYRLDAYSVMSNHVHTIFKPFVSETNLREFKNSKWQPSFHQ
jgi:putative transposase